MATKKMRTKRVEIDKHLAIYKEGDIDINENSMVHRPVESVETGVEKEEEQEHHLQKVINNSSTESKAQTFIPTPDASKRVENYNQLYKQIFIPSKNYIRFTSTVEHCVGTTYCLDSKDLEWLNTINRKPQAYKISEDLFELVMDRIENYADRKTTNPEDIKIFTIDTMKHDLGIPDVSFAVVHEIFSYWKKRHQDNLYKRILVAPHIKYQTKDNSLEDSDPYICFRGRDSKPVRRTRLVDQNATLKLDNLYNTLQSSMNLVRLVKQREEARHKIMLLERDIPASKIKLSQLKRKYNWVDKKHKSLTPVSPGNDKQDYSLVELKKPKTEQKPKFPSRSTRPPPSTLHPGLSKPKINIPFDYKDDWALLGLHLPFISQSEGAFISPDQYHRSFQAHNISNDEYNVPVFNRWRVGRGGRLILDRRPAYVNKFSPFPHDDNVSNNYSEDSLGWIESNLNLPIQDSAKTLSYYDDSSFRKKMLIGMNHHHRSSSNQPSSHWSTKYPSPSI